jgi:hypothetical protein
VFGERFRGEGGLFEVEHQAIVTRLVGRELAIGVGHRGEFLPGGASVECSASRITAASSP